jgi:hypothetical protein
LAYDAGQLIVVIPLLAFSERDLRIVRFICRLLRPLAVGKTCFDHEGVAAVDRWWPSYRSVEVSFDLLVQAMEDRPLTDR